MITNEEIICITQNVLGTMLELAPLPEDHPSQERGSAAFTGCIQISGQWQGAVVLQGTPALGRLFAARFFELAEEEVTEADLCDAIAELTNMIGGNIKGQVPGPSYLSIPSVTTGCDFDFHLPGSTVIAEVPATCAGEVLIIRLCEGDQTAIQNLTKLD